MSPRLSFSPSLRISARVLGLLSLVAGPLSLAAAPGLKKIRDVVIYADPQYHCAFPSVVQRPDGELLLAFRRAPNRLLFSEAKNSHVDPNSFLVSVRSRDGGATWTAAPQLLYADAWGGSQDPCLLQLRDGELLCFSYGWSFVRPDGLAKLKQPVFGNLFGSVFNGGFYLRSTDGGRAWSGPFTPPHIAAEVHLDPRGRPIPAYNRGAPVEGRDGRLFWAVAVDETTKPRRTAVHLLVSTDRGATWTYACPVATDPAVMFNETSLVETVKGDLVAFLRTDKLNGDAALARSTDGGKSFGAWQHLKFKAQPLHGLRLRDGRVLLTYGYRVKPLGIRARLLDAECTNAESAPEFVVRDDGATTDLGYSWSVQLDAKRVLVAYYMNLPGGAPPHIAGSILEIE
ncbi:MAG: exo-alpha-sialidase [Verrucomicrobia bacterium]|nr:exo-alpha-sialidase [Verrucomicrobiota bacterium]